MEINSYDSASVLGGGETWQRLKGKGGRQRISRHKGSEKGKRSKKMLPSLYHALFSNSSYFLFIFLFNLFSSSPLFFSSLQKTTFQGHCFPLASSYL